MAPFRDYFVKEFQTKTGITVNYNETNYDTWYQNCKNDGLNKTGAYDIYVMDDNWVPEFAAGKIVQSLDQLGLKVNPDILPAGSRTWACGRRNPAPRMKDFANAKPELYSIVIIDDVEILYYNKDHLPDAAGDLGRHLQRRQDDQGAGHVWLVAPRREGQPDHDDLSAAAEFLWRQFRQRRLDAGLRRTGRRGRALPPVQLHPLHARAGVAEYDTDQEVQLMLEGKCTALTEYTGLAQRVDDPASSKVVGKIDMAATPKQVKSGPADRHLHRRRSPRAPRIRKARCSSWSGSPRAIPSSSSPGNTAVRR